MPIAAYGTGGRQVRTDEKYGNIYDHFAVIFEYADGKRVFSYCRQMPKLYNEISDHIFGTKGTCNLMKHAIKGTSGKWAYDGGDTDMYVEEHKAYFTSLRAGRPINDMVSAANSSMMGILGRNAAYTGKRLEWAKAIMASDSLSPTKYEWGPNPVPPVAKPGA
jgi:myo-inositol 2-dehydrogenase / D-chiro-inositol 1-dehydrogenase